MTKPRSVVIATLLILLGSLVVAQRSGYLWGPSPDEHPKGSPDFRIAHDYWGVVIEQPPVSTLRCLAGQSLFPQVTVRNHSLATLTSAKMASEQVPAPANISHRIFALDHDEVLSEGPRSLLRQPLGPGASQTLVVAIHCPKQPGRYRVLVDVVQEGVSWGYLTKSVKKLAAAQVLEVIPDDAASLLAFAPAVAPLAPWEQSTLMASQQAHLQLVARLALGQLQVSRYHYEAAGSTYQVTNAGSQYPMIWTRDLATIARGQPAAQVATSYWPELFLMNQTAANGVPDWLALTTGETGKNDILSDQELWTIIAALEGIRLGYVGPSWLEKPLASVTGMGQRQVGDWLLLALNYVLAQRFDPQAGCLVTGHVADWGDVGLQGRDDRTSTKFHGPKVCGIYGQALLYQALNLVAQYLPAANQDSALAARGGITGLKNQLERFVQQRLWQADKGFFRIHHHLEPLVHKFAEDDIFPLGGNVLAYESGLTTPAQTRAIADTILNRQKQFGNATVGAVLLPCYPAGTFENPIMDERYEYQNGGDWDWYGPRAARLIYEVYPAIGWQKLAANAALVVAQGAFYEWRHLDGRPGGGRHYNGSAAAWLWVLKTMTAAPQAMGANGQP